MSELIERVRSFNRQWTEVIGLLDQGLLDTEHTLAEARVIFELARQGAWERLDLRERLTMDASFLTRVLSRLEKKRLVEATQSDSDGRRLTIRLTKAGRSAFEVLNSRSDQQVKELLAPLTRGQRKTIASAMTVVSHSMRPRAEAKREVSIRGLETGDMGWVIQRHAEVYADEFGWDITFEGLVAKIVADFHANFRPGRESCWVAEVDGARAGCVFCCEREASTAQLRILLVEPWARGLGLGARLVDECIAFARNAGYERMMLWTNDVLVAARRIYQAAGFVLTEEEPHHSFGHDLIGQNWELELDAQ